MTQEHTMHSSSTLRRLLVTATLMGCAMAWAQTETPVIDKRQARQERRIAQGVASGQLTPKETAQLNRREARIANDEASAKADGKVTQAERQHLRHEENRASKAIHHKKHNAQTAQ
jgi:DNA-binding transcriptional regulator of glucitol operon